MTNPPTFTVKIRAVDGTELIDSDTMALMLGVDAHLIDEHLIRRPGLLEDGNYFNAYLPHGWIKQGRRRTREAAAATGSNDILSVLSYWAQRDLGATIAIQLIP
jgi:hypothetical protein